MFEQFEIRRLFSHSLLKVYIFSVLTENLIFRCGPKIMICDITNYYEASPGPIFCINKNGLYSEVADILYLAV